MVEKFKTAQTVSVHVWFRSFLWKIPLDKTKGVVYNKREHKILLFLNPYGDWYERMIASTLINVGSLTRTGIDTDTDQLHL